jgi:hypothetical protein
MQRSSRDAQLTLDALLKRRPDGAHPARAPSQHRASPPALDVTHEVPAETDPEVERSTLEARIRERAGQEVRLRLTDNSHTMLSTRLIEGVRSVRLHRMFVTAPVEVIDAVGRYIARGDRQAGAVIDQYIEAHQHRIARKPRRPTPLRPHGLVYDLAEIQRALSLRYFDGRVELPIGWGRAGSARGRRGRRTIRMGVYLIDERAIRIHPALDQHWVPRFFVEWVVFHEMVHHVVPALHAPPDAPDARETSPRARRHYHSPAFRERERDFEEYDRALAWERENLHRLIASRALRATRSRS